LKISKLTINTNGVSQFNLNVGGFSILRCRWYPQRRRVVFPQRRSKLGRYQTVVKAHGRLVSQLRQLLESGQSETPRDRRPRTFKFHYVRLRGYGWYEFAFTVRGFTICHCRWLPDKGSIQLPVTFFGRLHGGRFVPAMLNDHPIKKRVVTAYGTGHELY
jgi:hypothetical protein